MKLNQKPNRAVTLFGLLFLIAVAAMTLCALLYLAKKAINAGRTIVDGREAMMTNELVKSIAGKLEDPNYPGVTFYDLPPGTIETDLGNGEFKWEIPDEVALDFFSTNGVTPWMVLQANKLGGLSPVIHTEEQHTFKTKDMKSFMLQRAYWEGVNAFGHVDMAAPVEHYPELGISVQTYFYWWVPTNQYVPPPPQPEPK